MTSPQEKQLKEQRQEVKEEHETRVPKGKQHLHFDANVHENWVETTCKSTTFATFGTTFITTTTTNK